MRLFYLQSLMIKNFLNKGLNLIIPIVLAVPPLSLEHGDKYTPHIVEYSAELHQQNTVSLLNIFDNCYSITGDEEFPIRLNDLKSVNLESRLDESNEVHLWTVDSEDK